MLRLYHTVNKICENPRYLRRKKTLRSNKYIQRRKYFDADIFFRRGFNARFRTVSPTVYPQRSWWEVGGDLRPPISLGTGRFFFALQKIIHKENPVKKTAIICVEKKRCAATNLSVFASLRAIIASSRET